MTSHRIARLLAVALLAVAAPGVLATPAQAQTQTCKPLTFDPLQVDATPASGRLPDAMVGRAYSASITVSGGDDPIYWTQLQNLPPGLSWSGGRPGRTLTISGTPTARGHFRVAFSLSGPSTNCLAGGRWDIEIGPPKITSIAFDDACADRLIVRGEKLMGFRNAPGELTIAGTKASYQHSVSNAGEDVLEVSPLPPGLPASVPLDVKVVTDGGATGQDVRQHTLHGREPKAETGAATSDVRLRRATLAGSVNAGCVATDWFFEYGEERMGGGFAYTHRTPVRRASGQDALAVQEPITDLRAGVTYHYRLTAVNGEGTVHGADRQFTLGGRTRIAPAAVPLDARLEKLRGILRARADDLQRRRLELEPVLQADKAALDKALALEQDVARDAAAVRKASQAVRTAIRALDRADNHLPPRVQKLADRRDRLAREVNRLQDLILSAQARGDGKLARGLVPQLEAAERMLERAAKEVVRNLPDKRFDPLLRALRDAEKAMDRRIEALERSKRHATSAREQAEFPLRRDLTQREALDRELIDLQTQLSHLDLQFHGLRVSAGGATVFALSAGGPFEELRRIDREIADATGLLDDLAAKRRQSKDEFIALQRDASDALTRLERAIRVGSYKKAGIDFVFNAYDVAEAGLKGGLAGAIAETAKKGVEALISAYIPDPGGIDPASAEGIANAEFAADLSNAFSTPQLLKTFGEQTIQQTATKYGADAFNQQFGQDIFKTIHGAVPPAWDSLRSTTPVQPVTDVGHVRSLQAKYGSLLKRKEQYDSLKAGVKPSLKEFGKGMVSGLVKDMLKAGIKTAIDSDEIVAWRRYFEVDARAKLYFPIYQGIARLYWNDYDHLQDMLERKRRLAAGYDASANLTTDRDEPFDKSATLEIHLDATGDVATAAPEVWIAGVKANQVGPGEYTFALSSLPEVPDALSLEIR